jgi:hypothetical protein
MAAHHRHHGRQAKAIGLQMMWAEQRRAQLANTRNGTGTCVVCRRVMAQLKDGTLYRHGTRGRVCGGSYRLPREAAQYSQPITAVNGN